MNNHLLFKTYLSPFFLLIIMVVLYAVACKAERAAVRDQVCFKDECVSVEVVESQVDVQRGLQERKFLDPEAGMLFIFPESRRYSFWMKETLIPLDMIWIGEDLHVAFIASDVPPCQADPCPVYTPAQDARYVLEVNAGYAQKNSITIGDVVEFRIRE